MNQNGENEPIIRVTDVIKKFTVGNREVIILKSVSFEVNVKVA